jgi:hypothetical protein
MILTLLLALIWSILVTLALCAVAREPIPPTNNRYRHSLARWMAYQRTLK